VLVVALLGCVATMLLALCWIILCWVETQLLLLTSQLLQKAYGVQVEQQQMTTNATGSDDKPRVETTLVGGKNQR